MRQRAGQALSDIQVQLKQRHDLIPNLVETVKGYATHEKTTLEDIAKLRGQSQSQSDPAQRGQTEAAITAAIGKVMAVAEAYPQLRASENFQTLQKDLADIEDQIQLARRYYNGAVRDFNVMIEQFPSNLIAGMFHFTLRDFFKTDEAEKEVPKVNLN